MSMNAIGGTRPQAYTPTINQTGTERPGEAENDGDSDDARVAAAASREVRSAVAAGVGRVIDQMA